MRRSTLQPLLLAALVAVAAQRPAWSQTAGSDLQLAPYAAPITPPIQTRRAGLSASLHLDLETLGVVAGRGARQAVSIAALQAAASIDTAQAGWWRGGQFDIMLMGLGSSGNLQTDTGAVQLPSNLWAPDFLRLYQLSYRQQLGPGAVQVGIMDMNNMFDTTGVAGHLHNASFGIAPTLTSNANIATFPNPGLGLMGALDLPDGWSVQAGVWQGDPPSMTGALHRGTLWIAETDRTWTDATLQTSSLKLGIWHLQQGNPTYGADSGGLYGVNEWRWKDDTSRHWAAFLQGGFSPAASNPVRAYLGAGLRLIGLDRARPDDVLTVGMAHARLRGLPSETVVEAVYSAEIAPHVYLQPDIERIRHPGGSPGRQWVAGIRIHLEQ